MAADSLPVDSKYDQPKQTTCVDSIILVIILLLSLTLGCIGSTSATPLPDENGLTNNNITTQSPNQTETRIHVSINNRELKNGSQTTIGKDPRMSMRIHTNGSIDSIILRTDGKTIRTYSPNSTNFSTTTTLELRDGGHHITVIATGDTTTVYSATIIKDAIAPRINFEEPFVTTGLQPPEQNYTLNTSNITLRGQLTDRSAVRRVIIEHRYEYTFSGIQTERSRYVIDDPGESFAQQLTLGPNKQNQTNGTNFMSIETLDTNNNRRVYTFTLNISDNRPPNIEILEATPMYGQSVVSLKVRVTDNVGVSAFGQRLGSGNETGFRSYYSENDIYQQRRKYETTLELPASLSRDGITLSATDLAGNNETINYSLAYAEFVTPKITINTTATQSLDGQTARVVGTIEQGLFSRVEIEARSSDGTLSDIVAVQTGGKDSRIRFNEMLQVDSYPVSVMIRVQDVSGTEHIRDYQITRTDLQQSPQPTPEVPTKTTSTRTQPTTTETTDDTPTLTATPPKVTTARESTKIETATQASSPAPSILLYFGSILPYTLGSALCTIVVYIIARKSLTN